MVSNYYYDVLIADDRRARLLREADTHRQANKLRVYRPAAHRRLLAGLGVWMVAQGERLKAGYESPARLPNRRMETAR